jgi:hypothetical protein
MRRMRLSRMGWVAPLAAVVAIGIIVALAFYVRGFQGTGSDAVPLPTHSRSPGAPRATSPAKHQHRKHSGKHSHKHTGEPTSVPGVTLGAGGGGLTITGTHTLVVKVHSSAPISTIGYLAPTSPDIAYGTVKNISTNWTVHTTVSGSPKYAIIWIYAGKSGAPVTCSLTIDGELRVKKTTTGAYGRQVCYA